MESKEKSHIKKLLRGIKIIIFTCIISIVVYYLSFTYIFRVNILDYQFVYENTMIIIDNLGHKDIKVKAYYPLIYSIAPFLILIGLWFVSREDKLSDNYGTAKFATEKDFSKMGLNTEGKGAQLGCIIKKQFKGGKITETRVPIATQNPLAILIVAPAGTGKTASIAMPNLLSIPNSCFVLDIKGELLQNTAGYRQKNFKNRILVFSPLSKEGNTMYFNPFDKSIVEQMEFVEMMTLAGQIAETIFVADKGKEGDHWISSAKTMFKFFAMYNMQKHLGTTLGDLSQAPKKDYFDELTDENKAKCMVEKGNQEDSMTGFSEMERDLEADVFKLWLQQTAADETLDDLVRNQARAYTTAADNEFASIKSTYDTYMNVFSHPRVAKATSKMSFDYEDLRNKRITVYVVITSEEIEMIAPLIRILVESHFKKLMRIENKDPSKFIYFILDEFIRFGKMGYLLEAPALCRSFGLVPIYITQSYEQIKKYYGDDDLKILRANAAYQVVFRMNSYDDAKTLSDMIGDYTRKKTSSSRDKLALIKENISTNEEGYKLVTPQDILSSPDGKVYILVGGYLNRPIKTDANLWFKNKKLLGADKTPYEKEEEIEQKIEESKEEKTECVENTHNKTEEEKQDKTEEKSPDTGTEEEKQEIENKEQETKQEENKQKVQENYSMFNYRR